MGHHDRDTTTTWNKTCGREAEEVLTTEMDSPMGNPVVSLTKDPLASGECLYHWTKGVRSEMTRHSSSTEPPSQAVTFRSSVMKGL